jgi:lipid A 4'-phosphatase
MSLAWVVGLAALFLWLGLLLRRLRHHPLQGVTIWLQDKGGRPGAWIYGALTGAGTLLSRSGVRDLAPRRVIYVLVCLLVGPGLLVNVVLKEHWGRARPSQVTEFGGARTFTPALTISDQCPRNCSFVSGEVSLGFWWLCFAFAARPGRRRYLVAGALAMGTLMGVLRVGAGGHFLSDAIFAALLTIAVCALLRDLMAIDAAAPAVGQGSRPV